LPQGPDSIRIPAIIYWCDFVPARTIVHDLLFILEVTQISPDYWSILIVFLKSLDGSCVA
jgi:hypothetical protein